MPRKPYQPVERAGALLFIVAMSLSGYCAYLLADIIASY